MLGKIFKQIDRVLSFFEEWTLFISVMAALVTLFISVIARYWFNYTIAWSEELVRHVIVYTTFIGCSVAVRDRSMIKIDALVQLVPKLKLPLSYLSYLATLIFSGMMIYYGYFLILQKMVTEQKTIIMRIPMVFIYVILPLMGMLMMLRTLQVMYEDFLTWREEWRAKKEKAAGRAARLGG